MKIFKSTLIAAHALLFIITSFSSLAQQAFYAGSSGKDTFYEVIELSNGTVLISGYTDNLSWITGTKTQLSSSGISNPSPQNNYAFIMQLSSDLSTIIKTVYLPQGTADDIFRMRFDNVPGQTTNNIYISGNTSSGYFLAKLNNNFINGTPTALSWIYNVGASGYPKEYHPWDVNNLGQITYIRGESHGYNWASIQSLDANGQDRVVPNWRTHWVNGSEQYGTLGDLGLTSGQVDYSGIVLKYAGRGDLRSWTTADYNLVQPDGNGGTKQGKWPLDVLFNSPWNPTTKPTAGGGYTGYKRPANSVYGGSAVVIDKRDNSIFIGMNSKSVLPDGLPDFEPAVIAYDASGSLKWWSRLYHEITPSGELRNSTPDQYIDDLEVDYSQVISQSSLVVLARCHGNNVENLWEGNIIASNPSANGFQNQFTGSEGNRHISWIGKLKLTNGTLTNSTYVAEYEDGMTGASTAPHSSPLLDGWPSPNSGWPNLNTTKCKDLEVNLTGKICVSCQGRRTITTANAHQKMIKLHEGSSAWNYFVRLYEADLSIPVYSSLIVGEWNPVTGQGGDNTEIYSVILKDNALYAVGKQDGDGSGNAKGNAIPVTNIPSWGNSTPANESAIMVRYPVDAPIPVNTATSIVDWDGDYVSSSQNLRSGNYTTTSGVDVDNDGSNDDTRIAFEYSATNALSSGAYSGAPIYGGIQASKVNTTTASFQDRAIKNGTTADALSVRSQNEGNFHAVIFFAKADFINGGNSNSVSFDQNSSLYIKFNREENLGELRWLVRDGSNFYVSQSLIGSGYLSFSSDNSDGNWATFNPQNSLNFNASGASFVDRNFSNITAVGFIADKDPITSSRHWMEFSQFKVEANIGTTTPANLPPTVSITSPSQNASFVAGDNVIINATASDSDGSVTSVQFYNGSTSLGTDTSAPYSISISNASAGTYNLTAVATDNASASTTSSVKTITVNPPSSGTGEIVVRAKMISGASDILELRLDNLTVKSWTVSGSDYANYTHSNISGSSNVKIWFRDQGTDIQLDNITINNALVLQAEAQQENTSVWENGSCGGDYSEKMHCTGHINFGTINFGGQNQARSADSNSMGMEAASALDFSVYPNPTSGTVYLNIESKTPGRIYIFNTSGTLIYSNEYVPGDLRINMEGFSQGLYFINIQTEKKVVTKKIILK